MTAVAEAPAFQAGIYEIDDVTYHADPVPGAGSLSHSGAKALLNCPAKFAYEREHAPAPTGAMERGTAAHTLVLGTGPAVVEVQADDWRKKATQERGDEIRAGGGIPLLTKDYRRVHEMAAALRGHRLASALFDPQRGGHAEQSLFWQDDRTGIWRRSRLDWMPDLGAGLPLIGDYKTCKSASPAAISKAVADFRYFMQDPWYRDGVKAVTGADCQFIYVFQETSPPYLVTVCQLDAAAVRHGRNENDRAIEIFRDCTASGNWPDYAAGERDPLTISLPRWAMPREDWM